MNLKLGRVWKGFYVEHFKQYPRIFLD